MSDGAGWPAETCAHSVARGWESKAIESQQESAAEARRARPTVTPTDARRQATHATLMLARTRALADLQTACAPAHRGMLEQAIADLDRRLAALKTPSAEPE
jgi:hypothetical protein